MNHIRQRQVRWLPCLGAFAFLLAGVCIAAADGLPSIKNTQLGFNHQFHNRHWTPLRVFLENPGPGRQATLVLQSKGNIIIAKPVWLPAHSRRTVSLSVFPDVSEVAFSSRDQSPIATPFVAKLTDGGFQTWSTLDVLGRPIPESAAVMLVADVRLPSYPVPTEVVSGTVHRPTARMVIPMQDLPARAADFDGINLIVLGENGPAELHTMQRQALVDWVHAGGTLVVVASTNTAAADWSSMASLRFAPPDRLATDPRLNRWGESPVFPDGVAMQRLIAGKEARILAGDEYSPLLVEERPGLGRIIACGIDAGDDQFRRWSGARQLNAELLTLSLDTIPAADRILAGSTATDGIISSLAGIKVLGRGGILLYLAAIVGGSVVVLVGFRFTRAPEHGWTVVIALALLAGGGAVVCANRWKIQPQPFLNEISVIQVSRDRQGAVAQTALGLYSPRAARYDMAVPAETVRLRPGTGKAVSTEPFHLRFDSQLRVSGLNVRANDLRTMYGRALLTESALPAAQAQLADDGVSVTFTNPLPDRLQDCFLKFNRFIVPLGDLAAGESRTFKDLRPETVGSDVLYSTRLVQTAEEELRSRVRRLFFPDPVYQLGRRVGANLMDLNTGRGGSWPSGVYGWSTKGTFPLHMETKELARRSISLWAVAAPMQYTGQQLTLPRGFMTLRMRDRQARMFVCGEGRFSGTQGARLVAEFGLPPECPDLTIDQAQVAVLFRGSAFQCRVQLQPPGFNGDSAPQNLSPSLAGGPVYSVPNPAHWYDPARRTFTVVVTIEPTGSAAAQAATAVNYWQIRELDMEIGGTTL